METNTLEKTVNWWDWTGICFSGLCLIHCIATPILLVSAPLWLASESVHLFFLLALIPITIIASLRAYQTHRNLWVLALLGSGIVFLGSAILVEEYVGEIGEILLTIIGSVLLITGHLKNRSCSH